MARRHKQSQKVILGFKALGGVLEHRHANVQQLVIGQGAKELRRSAENVVGVFHNRRVPSGHHSGSPSSMLLLRVV